MTTTMLDAPWLRVDKPYTIAELSANHAGSLERSLEIVRAAAASGASCLKTQTYRADGIAAKAPIGMEGVSGYSTSGTEWEDSKSLWHLLDGASMPWEFNAPIRALAKELGMDFMSSPFENAAVDHLESVDVDAYKIASIEIIDITLLRKVASTGKPVVVSTGMATVKEIADALHELRKHGAGPIALLKCTSAYPASIDQANLKTLIDMRQRFPNVTLGVSDHTLGPTVPIAAMALGSRIIEKHFILSRSHGGPDSTFSVEPHEWADMVKSCQEVYNSMTMAMGTVQYGPLPGELTQFRRSVFAVRSIKRGEPLVPESHRSASQHPGNHNVAALRPNLGLHPRHLDSLVGCTAGCDIPAGTPITWDVVEGGDCTSKDVERPEDDQPGHSLAFKRVLITGGTGTIGNEIIKYMGTIKERPVEVIVFSRDELKQSEMRTRFVGFSIPIRFELGDVRDVHALKRAMRGVHVVLHAAALKQVPAIEMNPLEGVKSNVIGTSNVIDAAADAGVEKLLFISTDKAVMPTNAYGASKMLAEKLICATGNINKPSTLAVSMCRYGNVFGSRGSIVPIIHKAMQNESKEPVLITDPDMTRFTLMGDTAVKLVIASVDLMQGGETFIPKLPAYRLKSLLQALGLPSERIKVVGPRPGEKVHESLMFDSESARAVDKGWMYMIPAMDQDWGNTCEHQTSPDRLAIGRYHSGNLGNRQLSVVELRQAYETWITSHSV